MATLDAAPAAPTPALVAAVESAAGRRVRNWRRPHTGLSPAQRFVATFDDDTSVFVKAAVDDDTEQWLRTDLLVMSTLDDLVPDLVPEIVAWTEADGRPVLLIEDLHDAHWPADHMRTEDRRQQPVWWEPGQLDLLFAALERLAAIPAPTSLARLSAAHKPRWPRIAADP